MNAKEHKESHHRRAYMVLFKSEGFCYDQNRAHGYTLGYMGTKKQKGSETQTISLVGRIPHTLFLICRHTFAQGLSPDKAAMFNVFRNWE